MILYPAYTHYFSTNNANVVNNSITKTPNETWAKISIKLSKGKSKILYCNEKQEIKNRKAQRVYSIELKKWEIKKATRFFSLHVLWNYSIDLLKFS